LGRGYFNSAEEKILGVCVMFIAGRGGLKNPGLIGRAIKGVSPAIHHSEEKWQRQNQECSRLLFSCVILH